MTLEEIEKDYGETLDKLTSLAEQKVKLQSELILNGLEEGKYYSVQTGQCEHIHFQYTKNTVFIRDMRGTVGYNGWNSLIFSKCIEVRYTRASATKSICHNKYVSLDRDFHFEELTEAEYNSIKNSIIEDIKNA